jgi:hypothetical protein
MSAAARRDRQMFRRLEHGESVSLAVLAENEEGGILADAVDGFIIGLEIDALVDGLDPKRFPEFTPATDAREHATASCGDCISGTGARAGATLHAPFLSSEEW